MITTTFTDRLIIKVNKETGLYSAWLPVTQGHDRHFHTPIYEHGEEIKICSIAVGSGKIAEVETIEEAAHLYKTYRKYNPL